MPDTATRLREEQAFARSWRAKPGFEQFAPLAQLLNNEFSDPAVRDGQVRQQLTGMLSFAAQTVPFYRDHWVDADVGSVAGPEDLHRLPLLRRHDVVSGFDRLVATGVDQGDPRFFTSRTSGSTGLPVKVLQTVNDLRLFALMFQRQARWFRYDVSGRLARIRLPKHLFRSQGGGEMRPGQVVRRPEWSYVGEFFHTGDEVHFSLNNPVDALLDWLKTEQPAYLLTFPPLLEQLALANQCQPLAGLKGVVAVASMLTEAMRSRVEQSFGVRVKQGYGLNELGLVAACCEAGNYHVHSEHVIVEIVDDHARPVAPGETGRLVLTTLSNRAMPLVRYDTGDMARAGQGDCTCGRTLPWFDQVLGRFVRYAGTPSGTRERVNGMLGVIARIPNELFGNIELYQFFQDTNEDLVVRVQATGALHPEFEPRLQSGWTRVNEGIPGGADGRCLRVELVDEIPRTPSGKQMDFVSAFNAPDPAFGSGSEPGGEAD